MENNFQLSSAAVTDRGLSEKRPHNEDAYLELADRGIFAVADGVGGAQAGDVASLMAIEMLEEAFLNFPETADAEEVMRAAIERANMAIYQMSQDLAQLSTMATTIVALHVAGNIATIGHTGDSRLYRLDSVGNLYRETNDHSVVAEEVRAGRMTEEQAENHPSRNVISRALGAEPSVEVDLKTIMIEPNTTFLLCSDGVTRHVVDNEIRDLLNSELSPVDVCERLRSICYDRGAEDNLTAVVVRVAAEAAPVSRAYAAGADHAEEVTVATARSPFDSYAETPALENGYEVETTPSNGSETDRITEHLDEAAPVVTVDTSEPDGLPPAADVPAHRLEETKVSAIAERMPTLSYESEPAGSSLGKIIPAILFLLIGAAVGAAAVYYLRPEPEPVPVAADVPVITEQKTENIPLTTFEESRRIVDRDPAGYVNSNAASAQEAEDYFLLGRAFLLTGKSWEAKRAFTEARDRLSQVDAANQKTLAAEIAMALAIINNGPAQEAFNREVTAFGSTTQPPTETAPQ